MGNFRRDENRSSGGRRGGGGFSRGGGFGRDSERPTMHQAVCDKCNKECEVPFRPTSGKPVYCSNCFESNRNSDSRDGGGRSFERPSSFEERRMYEATCDECGNTAKLPFQPRGDKPVYCSNCFETKNDGGGRDTRSSGSNQASSGNNNQKFDELNAKLDAILKILTPLVPVDEISEEIIEEVLEQPTEEAVEVKEKKPKKASKKKA